MKKIAFFISKPLQLMITLAIINDITESVEIDLIITNDFHNAKLIHKRLQTYLTIPQVKNIQFFEEQSIAYKNIKRCKYEKIFIDSDVGFTKYMQLLKVEIFNKKVEVCVYEEGLGTYRQDIYDAKNILGKLKKKILHALGGGVYFGGNRLTSEIYLFRPEEYKPLNNNKIKIIKIKSTIEDVLDKFKVLNESIFPIPLYLIQEFKDKSKSFAIYLSGWEIDLKIISKIRKENEFILIKLHPQIKSTHHYKNVLYIDQYIPAEIILHKISEDFKPITVFHHGSSVTRYICRSNIQYKLV